MKKGLYLMHDKDLQLFSILSFKKASLRITPVDNPLT